MTQSCYPESADTTSTTTPSFDQDATASEFNSNLMQSSEWTVDEESTAPELAMSQFEGLVASFFRASAVLKQRLRSWVIEDVSVGRRLSQRIEIILEEALSSAKPSRLDDAIDVLSDPRVHLGTYLREARLRNALPMHEDALYILVRAAGRHSDEVMRFIVPWTLEDPRASVREGAVEALADLRTPAAIRKLQSIAVSDSSQCVRESANEAIAEINED